MMFSEAAIHRRCHIALHRLIEGGAENYDRARHLPRLLPGFTPPAECEEKPAIMRIARELRRALSEERQLGRSGHWSYDVNRHIGLRQALRAEMHQLRKQHSQYNEMEIIRPGPSAK